MPNAPDERDFQALECEQGQPTNFEALRKELGADAIAYVDSYGGEVSVVTRGVPCGGDAACTKAWREALKPDDTEAFFVEQEPLSPRRTHYVFAFGKTVKRAGSHDELRAVLAPIDGPWKAQLVMAADGHGGRCGPHAIRTVAGGYELFESRLVRICQPIISERWLVKVDQQGERHDVMLVERDVSNACI